MPVLRVLSLIVLFLTVLTSCDDIWADDANGSVAEANTALVPQATGSCSGLVALRADAHDPIWLASYDPDLFDHAVRHYSSLARCGEGGASFAPDAGLVEVATAHSEDMRVHNFFDHTSVVAGKETLGKRLRLVGVTYRAAAENLALMSLFNFRPGEAFELLDEDNCVFRDPESGELYRRRTYAELAKVLVDGWMASPGHRANLLNDRYRRLGSGLSIDPDRDYCGSVYATQNFAD